MMLFVGSRFHYGSSCRCWIEPLELHSLPVRWDVMRRLRANEAIFLLGEQTADWVYDVR